MKKTLRSLLLISVAAGGLAACALPPKLEDAQYWQRKSATSALYMRGPKAQQTLHKDIADCTNEIRELERMAPLREAIPADNPPESQRYSSNPMESNAVSAKLSRWDTPKRDGHLYSEHFNYTDFEGCMDYKGWERVEALPYEQAKVARESYMENIFGNKYQSKYPERQPGNADPYASTPDTKINN